MDTHFELLLAVVVEVVPFLLLFLVRNIDSLLWVLTIVVRLLYILAVVVALKRHHDEVDR